MYFETRLGGMSQTAVLILLGIHWTKKEEFLSCIPAICSSTSFMEILPLNTAATVLVVKDQNSGDKSWNLKPVRNLPFRGSAAAIRFEGENI